MLSFLQELTYLQLMSAFVSKASTRLTRLFLCNLGQSVVQKHLLTSDLKIRNKQHLIYFLLKLCQTAKKFKIYDHISGKVTMIDFYICKQ